MWAVAAVALGKVALRLSTTDWVARGCRRGSRSGPVRFCGRGAEGGRIADLVFELGAGEAFVAEHDLAGREGAFASGATARSSTSSGASSNPTGSRSGEQRR